MNQQVTLALCTIGAVPWVRGGLVFISQILGAMASAGVVRTLFPGPLAVTTSLNGGTNKAQGLFIEMVGATPQFEVFADVC
jgi:aquaporin rerated protein, other eukaryote